VNQENVLFLGKATAFPMVLTTLLLLESICLGASLSVPEVAAPVGRIRGISEGQVHVFRGIPYAEAPVGALRWRPPKPIQPWQGVHDASRYRSYCMSIKSKDVLTKGGSEDCLYLNVYAPSEAQRNTSLPCLVWIHGGSFETGSSNDYNATKLVNFWRSQQSYALVVTLNYRLNVFGFLGIEPSGLSLEMSWLKYLGSTSFTYRALVCWVSFGTPLGKGLNDVKRLPFPKLNRQ
jgi:hypothetical protein